MIGRTPSTEDTRPGPDCYPRPATVVAMTVRSWIREHLLTADAIYGLILYSALVAGVSDENSDATEVLGFSVGTLLIFWAAHVFAKTLAGHDADTGLGRAMWEAFAESSGMLYASVLPSVPLFFALPHLLSVDDAVSLSLLIAMVVLGALGYNTLGKRGKHPVLKILGAFGTAFFGFVIIVLNIAVH